MINSRFFLILFILPVLTASFVVGGADCHMMREVLGIANAAVASPLVELGRPAFRHKSFSVFGANKMTLAVLSVNVDVCLARYHFTTVRSVLDRVGVILSVFSGAVKAFAQSSGKPRATKGCCGRGHNRNNR